MNQTAIRKLLGQYPTPLYVFEEHVLKTRVKSLRARLPKDIGLCYAVKANPFLGRFLKGWVERFEICSPGEMYICESQGIDAKQFVLSGVHKDEKSMRYAFEHGLCAGILTVESVSQFELIRSLSKEYRRKVRLLFRLTSGSQFGLEAQEIIDLLKAYGTEMALEQGPDPSDAERPKPGEKGEKLLIFAGIQFFSGTQKTSLKKHRRELSMLDDFIDRIFEETGWKVPELEYGPGLPAAYFVGETFDEDAWLAEFSALLAGMRNTLPVMLELGRGIAASCGSLLSRVVDVKCNHAENYAILDSGIHHLTYFGQFMAMKHPVCEVWPPREAGEEDEVLEWNLCGSLCTTNDLLVKKLPVKDLKIGDVLVFHNTGAYSMTEGISLFLSRDLPAVVWLKEDGETKLLRDAQPIWALNGAIEKSGEDAPLSE